MRSDVAIRPVVEADLPLLFGQQADEEAARVARVPVRDRDAFFAVWHGVLADPTVRAVAILAEGEVVGHVVCFGPPEKRNVGYWLGRAHWGRGIATAALAAFLADLPDRPLYAHVARGNTASIRVLEKCGFRPSRLAPDDDGEHLYELS